MTGPREFPLPSNLPTPVDDGACAHLPGLRLPALVLPSTGGRQVELAALTAARTVFYCYPMTGVSRRPLPAGWDGIPGARGCTPQACAFRDHHQDLLALGAEVYGLSTQPTAYQQEVSQRLHLPFALLSDADLAFGTALRLPTFEVDGMRLIRRLTIIARGMAIEHVLYPVCPSDRSAEQTIEWLAGHPL